MRFFDLGVTAMALPNCVPSDLPATIRLTNLPSALVSSGNKAYLAFLGLYCSNLKRISVSKQRVVEIANEFGTCIGLKELPALMRSTARKMGLDQTPGVKIDKTNKKSRN